MKYFATAAERIESGHENYVEFQLPTAVEELWDSSSIYMLETEMAETGFAEFWFNCVLDHIVSDMCSFKKEELGQMLEAAKSCGGTVLAVANELWGWVDANLSELSQRVGVEWASDRAMARWQEQRDAYPINPKFLEEEQAIKGLPIEEYTVEYERLLQKYNMPKYFFPFPLDEPENW